MSNLKLSSNDYLAVALAVSNKDKMSPSNIKGKAKKLSTALIQGKKEIKTFKRDSADKISKYFSMKDQNMGQAVQFWQGDGEISQTDLNISDNLKEKIDTNSDNKISTSEFSNALVNGKITIGDNYTPSTIFKSDSEKGNAEQFLDRFSDNAFDPNRSVEDRLLNLKPINLNGLNGSVLPKSYEDASSVDIEDLQGTKNFDELAQALKDSLATDPNVTAQYGNNPSSEQIDDYIKENFDAIMQQIGDDIPYEGFVSLIGDSDAMGTIENGFGVCNDIHSVVTALRRSMGQESYMVYTSGSDAAHVFSVFKEDGKWNIQNYGKVVETDAGTLAELYDIAMPQQRKIKVYDVDSDGNVKQVSTEHFTALGLQERKFKGETGIDNYNPWTSQDGATVGNTEMSFAKNGFYIGINPSNNTIGTAYYKRSQEGDTRKIQGGAIKAQHYTSPGGEKYRNVDAKYEVEKKYDNAESQKYGRSHFSTFVGSEINNEQTYWGGLEDGGTPVAGDGDAAVRFGLKYHRNDSKLIGDKNLKFELGHQTKVGATITFDADDPLDPKYAGRMNSDLEAESKLVTGAFYQTDDKNLTVRGGLASGLDLVNIDGIKQPLEQVRNAVESDVYLDVTYAKGPIAAKVLGEIPLHTIGETGGVQYKAGAGLAFAPSKEFAIGVTYLHERVINDNIDSIRVGAEFTPTTSLTIGGGVSTPIAGDNAKNVRAEGFVKYRF